VADPFRDQVVVSLRGEPRLAAGKRKEKVMIRSIAPILLALSFIGGATVAMADPGENDNDRTVYGAKDFYKKVESEQGGQ
jgi:hypothetical protein